MTTCARRTCGREFTPIADGDIYCSPRCQEGEWGSPNWQIAPRPGQPGTRSLRIDPTLRDRLRLEAAARDVSVNWLVTKLLNEALDRLRPAAEFKLTRDDD